MSLTIAFRTQYLPTCVAALLVVAPDALAQRAPRLSDDLSAQLRAGETHATSVIVTGTSEQIDAVAARHALKVLKRLQGGAVLDVPAGTLDDLAADAGVDQLSGNTVVRSHMAITNEAVGATLAWSGDWTAGGDAVTGRDVGIAVIDSGIAALPALKTRVVANVNFTDSRGKAQDQWGHGTHVAGIIAASQNRTDIGGVAPAAHLLNLKVLGADGSGYVADVIEAVEWVVTNRRKYRVRVINLSLGAPPTQSAHTDPLCLAIARAHAAGVITVTAAGNRGRTDEGTPVYGTINSPGHCPHAITVGALNTKGTAFRSDDVMATYSSKGPTRDGLIKPDLVAPGNKIVGLLAPGAALAAAHPELVIGTGEDARLMLSGTSMSAAVVSGAVALLVDNDARFTSPIARLALQYSASLMPGVGLVVSGAGSLNVAAALAMPTPEETTEIAGEETQASKITYGIAGPADYGKAANTLWGSSADNILWGDAHDNILWGDAHDNILWGNATDNILWGDAANILWGD